MGIINDEFYFVYLDFFSFYIDEILDEKKIDSYYADVIKENVEMNDVIERVRPQLIDAETGFILNDYDCDELFRDAIEMDNLLE